MHPLVQAIFDEMDEGGWSLRSIEKVSGVSRACTQHWRRRSAPSLPNFEAVANALGFDLVLIRREGPPPKSPSLWERPKVVEIRTRKRVYAGKTKLTWEQVEDIRTGRLRAVEYAKLYDVSAPLICRIQKGKAWPKPPDQQKRA